MKKFTRYIGLLILCLFCFTAAYAVGPQDKVQISKPKGVTLTNHSAITSTVAVGSCTAINMAQYGGGTVQAVRSSGTGTISIALKTCETAAGTYVDPYELEPAIATSSGLMPFPAMATNAASYNRSWSLKNIRAKYIKLVPTISGTATYTILFTPSAD